MWSVRQTPAATADAIGSQGINLPSGVCLTRSQVARVCDAIRDAVAGAGRLRNAA
jgi:perosamine synthetase